MKYFSLDLETTGLNENKHQVIEIGGVIDDLENPKPIDELPEFHCYVTHDVYNVSEYCLGLHSDTGLFKRLSEKDDDFLYVPEEKAAYELAKFIYNNYLKESERATNIFGTKVSWNSVYHDLFEIEANNKNRASQFRGYLPIEVVSAGKNFGAFDLKFLEELPMFTEMIRFHHRVLDPGSIYTRKDDEKVPNLETCLERAGFSDEVPHHAVEDAKLVVKLIRKYYNISV